MRISKKGLALGSIIVLGIMALSLLPLGNLLSSVMLSRFDIEEKINLYTDEVDRLTIEKQNLVDRLREENITLSGLETSIPGLQKSYDDAQIATKDAETALSTSNVTLTTQKSDKKIAQDELDMLLQKSPLTLEKNSSISKITTVGRGYDYSRITNITTAIDLNTYNQSKEQATLQTNENTITAERDKITTSNGIIEQAEQTLKGPRETYTQLANEKKSLDTQLANERKTLARTSSRSREYANVRARISSLELRIKSKISEMAQYKKANIDPSEAIINTERKKIKTAQGIIDKLSGTNTRVLIPRLAALQKDALLLTRIREITVTLDTIADILRRDPRRITVLSSLVKKIEGDILQTTGTIKGQEATQAAAIQAESDAKIALKTAQDSLVTLKYTTIPGIIKDHDQVIFDLKEAEFMKGKYTDMIKVGTGGTTTGVVTGGTTGDDTSTSTSSSTTGTSTTGGDTGGEGNGPSCGDLPNECINGELDIASIQPSKYFCKGLNGAAGLWCERKNRNACGDKIKDEGEECDDGNFQDNDGCSMACKWDNTCGDGIKEFAADSPIDEQCDDGNKENSDGCSSTCQNETSDPITGCIDPTATNYNPSATVNASWTCTYDGSTTGDTIKMGCTNPQAPNYTPFATIDDGSCTTTGGSNQCSDAQKACSDCESQSVGLFLGSSAVVSMCTQVCSTANIVCQVEERKDDKSGICAKEGTGCIKGDVLQGTKVLSYCKDDEEVPQEDNGRRDPAYFVWTCGDITKDKNTWEDCSNKSRACPGSDKCGNGTKDEGEECDDGNQDDTDACGNDCKKTFCGDGKVNAAEECDPVGSACKTPGGSPGICGFDCGKCNLTF